MINFSRVRTIIEKEWAEVFKNKIVLFTVILMPLLFTAMPLGLLFAFGGDPNMAGGDSTDMPASFLAACTNLPASDCMQVFLINEFMLLYMIMPIMIPIAIAAYSIVGEKTTRSLEPLLATPITTEELMIGKGLAAVIPAVIATWSCFLFFVLVSPLTGISAGVRAHILSPTWLLAILVVGPLMAIMAVNFAIFVSSRAADPRVAEQISAVLIVPILAVLFGQIAGVITLNLQLIFIAIALFLVIDIVLVILGARLFQREAILTRWK